MEDRDTMRFTRPSMLCPFLLLDEGNSLGDIC